MHMQVCVYMFRGREETHAGVQQRSTQGDLLTTTEVTELTCMRDGSTSTMACAACIKERSLSSEDWNLVYFWLGVAWKHIPRT